MILKYRAWDNWRKRMSVVDRIYIDTEGVRLYDDFGEYWRDFRDVKLMQSTGLKDKNGKEIFEGDIVKCSGLLGTIESFKAMWICSFVKYNNYQKVGFFAQEIEVVGNVYENPELLEDKE